MGSPADRERKRLEKERKRAEQALRESQARYERVLLASNAGFWDWDVETDEFYVSPRFLEMGGFAPGTVFASREDFIRRWRLHPEDRRKWRLGVRKLFASDRSRLSMELREIVDGETLWRRIDGMCFRDARGRVVRWTGSATDITDRKRAEEALHESQERYELAMAASEEAHYDHWIDSDALFASERLNEINGFPPGTRFKTREDYLKMRRYYGDDGETYHAAIRAALAPDWPDRFEFEYRIVRP